MALDDYFTFAEFEELIGDQRSARRFDESDVLEAREDVVERLESWANTAWQVSTFSMSKYLATPMLELPKVPVRSVTTLTADGTTIDASGYQIDEDAGLVRWGGTWEFGPPAYLPRARVEITYTYGFTSAPRPVKNCCIKATRSLLMGEEQRSKVPTNTSSYGTERTNFQLRADRGLIRPWPWDERQSQYMRAYWEMKRPRNFVTV